MSRVLFADDQALARGERGLVDSAVQQTESEWSQLIAMLELAQRWQELIDRIEGQR